MILTAQLSPIMDRVGRLLVDSSPHLMNDVSEFNTDLETFRRVEDENDLNSIEEESSLNDLSDEENLSAS